MAPSVHLATYSESPCISCNKTPTPYYDDTHAESKEIIRNFLIRTGLRPRSVDRTPRNAELHAFISQHVALWKSAGDDVRKLKGIVETSCDYIELAYGHTSLEHQCYTALYCACILYVDDLGGTHLEAIAQFARRFALGEKQLSSALDTLAELLKQAHQLWSPAGADAIISGTIDAVSAMVIEYTTQDMKVSPLATWWPNYIRVKTGISPPFIHFIFMKSWRPNTECYLQMLPFMEFWISGANDVLSFYKEQLEGETKNYVHIRAAVDQVAPVKALRTLADELVDMEKKIRLYFAEDHDLADVWDTYVQGFLTFHILTSRYKLSDLGF